MSLDAWDSARARAVGLFGPQDAKEIMEFVRALVGPPSAPASLVRNLRRVGVSKEAAEVIESLCDILRPTPAASARCMVFRLLLFSRDLQHSVLLRDRTLLELVKGGISGFSAQESVLLSTADGEQQDLDVSREGR